MRHSSSTASVLSLLASALISPPTLYAAHDFDKDVKVNESFIKLNDRQFLELCRRDRRRLGQGRLGGRPRGSDDKLFGERKRCGRRLRHPCFQPFDLDPAFCFFPLARPDHMRIRCIQRQHRLRVAGIHGTRERL